jgi:hypothetical protein
VNTVIFEKALAKRGSCRHGSLGRWLILDNLTLTLVRDTDVTRVTPKFGLDAEETKQPGSTGELEWGRFKRLLYWHRPEAQHVLTTDTVG